MSTAVAVPASSETSQFAALPFEEKLDRFARLAVHVGLNLQAGQELLISASTEMMPLVRRITEHAYKAGALLVTTFYSDDEASLARFKYAEDASFDHAAKWLADGIAAAFSGGAARLALAGSNPGAACRTGSGEGFARQHRGVEGQQAGHGTHYAPCHQLVHPRLSHACVGEARLSGPARRRGG